MKEKTKRRESEAFRKKTGNAIVAKRPQRAMK